MGLRGLPSRWLGRATGPHSSASIRPSTSLVPVPMCRYSTLPLRIYKRKRKRRANAYTGKRGHSQQCRLWEDMEDVDADWSLLRHGPHRCPPSQWFRISCCGVILSPFPLLICILDLHVPILSILVTSLIHAL